MASIKELKEKDLDKVTGGTAYSDSTYYELNIQFNQDYQIGTNHPVITTIGNTCKLSSKNCFNCSQFADVISLFSGYCCSRSYEYDPAKK